MNPVKKNGLLQKSVRLTVSLLLLAFVLAKSHVLAADPVDGTEPPRMTNFTKLSPELQKEGWLLLFDGRTLFGWDVKAGATSGVGHVEAPRIKIKNEAICVETPHMISLTTPLFFPQGNSSEATIAISWKLNPADGADTGLAPVPRFLVGKGDGVFHPLAADVHTEKGISVAQIAIKPELCSGSLFRIDVQPGSTELFDLRVRYTGSDNVASTESRSSFWREPSETMKVADNDGMELTGKGRLESVKSYGDFLARFEYMPVVAGGEQDKGCNSGFFFRCIEGSPLNGYECQINNRPPQSDRGRFLGNDTGSIFRRVAARPLPLENNQWNRLAIMACGPTIRTWVNGVPVVCWTDERVKDENPRKGLRLVPGTIQLQGHDDWTCIRFRDFFIHE
ncbi:MAG: DUF1080 domain-containing protein [Planctomycetia bacterium]|nr:DUF1080 domain-containing protein [Planctomycetia bacterium]